MPGHILRAVCGCGYSTEVCPGYSEFDGQAVGIAYSAGFASLETLPIKQIKMENLQPVADPFLTTHEEDKIIDQITASTDFESASDEATQTVRRIIFKAHNGAAGIYLCPSCKCQSLFFIFSGHWD